MYHWICTFDICIANFMRYHDTYNKILILKYLNVLKKYIRSNKNSINFFLQKLKKFIIKN